MIVTNEQMKEKFKKYGEFMSFDLTYGLVREKTPYSTQYGVGLFCGLSPTYKITAFAAVFMAKETKEAFRRMFHEFFILMENQPSAILTDDQASIKAALNDLYEDGVFGGTHLQDSFHILRNLRHKLIDKSRMKYFSKLMRCENRSKFSEVLLNLPQFNSHENRYL